MTSLASSAAFAPFRPNPLRSAASALRTPPARLTRPICLDAGDIVRIVDGRGTLVHARSGVLWITDEHTRDDVILSAGATHRIASNGVTVVEAHRVARLVVEVPHVADAPANFELVFNGRSRRLTLAGSGLAAWLRRIRRAIVRAIDVEDLEVPRETAGPLARRRATPWHDRDQFTPDAVRDRLLRAHPHPYY